MEAMVSRIYIVIRPYNQLAIVVVVVVVVAVVAGGLLYISTTVIHWWAIDIGIIEFTKASTIESPILSD
jgi:cyanate permease